MKKRVLSMVLALALCVTAFSGIALAAPQGRLQRNINRVDNMLANAIDEQKAAIKGVVDAVSDDADGAVNGLVDELVWNPESPVDKDETAAIPYLITPKMLEKTGSLQDNETLSYFVLLKFSEDFTDTDREKYTKVATLVDGFKAINDKYNTAGEPLSESLKKFDPYGEELTALYEEFMKDAEAQLELFDYLDVDVFADSNLGEDINADELKSEVIEKAKEIYRENLANGIEMSRDDLLKQAQDIVMAEHNLTDVKPIDTQAAMDALMDDGQAYAYQHARDLVAKYIPQIFQTQVDDYNFEEGNGVYLDAFLKLMDSDADKKEAAIIIGKDVMKLAASGAMATVRDYVKARKDDVKDLIGMDKEIKKDILSADKDAVYNVYYNKLIPTVLGWLEEDAKGGNPAIPADVQAKIADLVSTLEARGLSVSGLVKSVKGVMDNLDSTKVFQDIWYNLGLDRLLTIDTLVIEGATQENPKEGWKDLAITLKHRLIESQFQNPENAFELNNCQNKFYLALDKNGAVEKNGVKITQDASVTEITYTPAENDRQITVYVFRGGYADEKGNPAPLKEFDVERYVGTRVITLKGYKEPTPPETVKYTKEVFKSSGMAKGVDTPYADVLAELNTAVETKTVTLVKSNGTTEEVAVTWPTESQEYEDMKGAAGNKVTIEGTYAYDEALVGDSDVDGKVSVEIRFIENEKLKDQYVKEGTLDNLTVTVNTPYADVLAQLNTLKIKLFKNDDTEGTYFDIAWPTEEPADYAAKKGTAGETAEVVGSYTVAPELVGNLSVNGIVEIGITFTPAEVTRTVDITNEDEASNVLTNSPFTLDDKGQVEVTVNTTVKNVPLVIIAVTEEGGTPANEGLVYQTIDSVQAAAYTFTINEKVLDDAKKDTMKFKVAVGNTAFGVYDEATFEVKKAGVTTELKPVWEEKTSGSISVKRKTLWDKVVATSDFQKNTTLKIVDKDGVEVTTVELTYDGTAYDANSSKSQKFEGTYVLADLEAELATLGYRIATDADENTKKYPIADGKYELTIRRPGTGGGGGGGGGGGSSTYYTEGNKFDGDRTIHLVGDTTSTKVVIDLIGPDGRVLKTITLTGSQFINGYDWDISDLLPLPAGTYTLLLRSTYGDEYDKWTFNVGGGGTIITSDIFNKTDHFNYIMGFDDGTVRPEAHITRDEVAAIMFRLLTDKVRTDNLTKTTTEFTDLPADHWAATAFATLNTLGIFRGRDDGTMGVGDDITRAEFAALCSRFAVVSASDLTTDYSDIAGNWAEQEIKTVSAAGWFEGSNGQFRPSDKITRAEVVTAMNRILGRDKVDTASFGKVDVNKFSDLKSDAWYYANMVEATVAHDYEVIDNKEIWKNSDETVDWTVYEE